MRAVCPVTSHRETMASVGKLCAGCASRLSLDLGAIADLYEELAEPRSMAPMERVSGSTEHPIPYTDAVGDAREAIRRNLTSWAIYVSLWRCVRVPGMGVRDLAGFLIRHVETLASAQDAAYFVDEAHELAWGAPRRAAYPERTTRHVERSVLCPECSRPAVARLRCAASLRASTIECPEGHTVETGAWLSLALLPEDARISTDVASVALYGDASFGDSIRQLVSRGRLVRGEDRLFALADIAALHREIHAAV